MLGLGAELCYIGGNSDKFYRLVVSGRTVVIQYGRRGVHGETHAKVFDTPEKAAAEAWRLLRAKTGKGYQVLDAAVMGVPEEFACPDGAAGNVHSVSEQVLRLWVAAQVGERARHRSALLYRPDLMQRSPRTAKQGAAVLLALMSGECPEDILVNCAAADPTERFLPPMALSHPNVTDQVEVAAFLAGSTSSPP